MLTGAPSYPLLDSLAALEGLALRHFHRRPGAALRDRPRGGRTLPHGAYAAPGPGPSREPDRHLPLSDGAGRRGRPLCFQRDSTDFGRSVLRTIRSRKARAPVRRRPRGGPFVFARRAFEERRPALVEAGLDPRRRPARSPPPDRGRPGAGGRQLSLGGDAGPARPPRVLALAPRLRLPILERLRGNLDVLRATLAGRAGRRPARARGRLVRRAPLRRSRSRTRIWSWRSWRARACSSIPDTSSISRRTIFSSSPSCRSSGIFAEGVAGSRDVFHRPPGDVRRGDLKRKPYPAAGTGAVAAPTGRPSFSRILASISSARSGLSRRNCLAFSRPWPMRRSP